MAEEKKKQPSEQNVSKESGFLKALTNYSVCSLESGE